MRGSSRLSFNSILTPGIQRSARWQAGTGMQARTGDPVNSAGRTGSCKSGLGGTENNISNPIFSNYWFPSPDRDWLVPITAANSYVLLCCTLRALQDQFAQSSIRTMRTEMSTFQTQLNSNPFTILKDQPFTALYLCLLNLY